MHLPHRVVPKVIVVAVAAGLLALAAILFTPSPAPAQLVISWTPASVTQTILARSTTTVPVSFTATENLSNVVVRVVPELAPYVQTNPTSFASIVKGQPVYLNLTISAPVDAVPKVVDGVIQLRSGVGAPRTFAQPLPIMVEIWQLFSDNRLGLDIAYPPDWIIRPGGRTTVFSNVSVPAGLSENALQTESFL